MPWWEPTPLEADLLVGEDTQNTAPVTVKASQTLTLTQQVDYTNLAGLFPIYETFSGQIPFNTSIFSDAAMPGWRAYLETIAAGEKREFVLTAGGKENKTMVDASVDGREIAGSGSAINGITVPSGVTTPPSLNGVKVPAIDRAKAMQLAQSVLDQAGDDNDKLRELFLHGLSVSSDYTAPEGKTKEEYSPWPRDMVHDAPYQLSFNVTQTLDSEDAAYASLQAPDEKSLSSTSGNIFKISDVVLTDANKDGHNESVSFKVVYTGGATNQLDIYNQFVGDEVLSEGGELSPKFMNFNTPVVVDKGVAADTEITVTSKLSADTTYFQYMYTPADPTTMSEAELQDWWLCYLGWDYYETTNGGTATYAINQTAGKADSTRPDGGISLTARVVAPAKVKVTSRFVDAATGKAIADPIVQDLQEFDTYKAAPQAIAGYHLLALPDNTEGTLGDKDVEVVFSYEKDEVPATTDDTHTSSTTSKATPKPSKGELPNTGDAAVGLLPVMGSALASLFAARKLRRRS